MKWSVSLFCINNSMQVCSVTVKVCSVVTITKLPQRVNFTFPVFMADRQKHLGWRIARRNTAILVCVNVTHRHVQTNTGLKSTWEALRVGAKKLCIFVYIDHKVQMLPEGLNSQLAPCAAVIIGGELNAKHIMWGCRRTNTSGRVTFGDTWT